MLSRRRFSRLAERLVSGLLEVKQTAGSNGIVVIAAFGASVVAARFLGPAARGELAAAVVYLALASAVADGGLNQAVPYFAARRKDEAPGVLGTTCVLAVGFGTVVAVAAYELLTFIEIESRAALLFLPAVPFTLLTTHLAAFMYGGGLLTQFNVIRVLQSALLLCALLLAVAMGERDVTVVVRYAIGLNVALTLIAVAIVGTQVPIQKWRVKLSVGTGLLRYAAQSYVGNLCWLVNSRLDQLLMSVMIPSAMLGIYATSVAYAGVVFSGLSAFAMIAFAKAGDVSEGDDVRVRGVINRFLMLSIAIGVPFGLAVALLAPWLYPLLFGSEFSEGVVPAVILCGASVVLGLNYTLSNGLRIRNEPLLPSVAEAAGVVVSVVGLLYVLPRAGIIGAAFVPLASYLTVLAILVYFSRPPMECTRARS